MGLWAGHYLTITLPSGPAIRIWVPVTLAPEPGDGGQPVRGAEQRLPTVTAGAALCQLLPSSELEWIDLTSTPKPPHLTPDRTALACYHTLHGPAL